MNFILGWNEPPSRVMSVGGILRWPDGRNMPDVHATLFEYGKYPVYLRLNAGCESPEIYRFQGSKGVLEVTEFGLGTATRVDRLHIRWPSGRSTDMQSLPVDRLLEINEGTTPLPGK